MSEIDYEALPKDPVLTTLVRRSLRLSECECTVYRWFSDDEPGFEQLRIACSEHGVVANLQTRTAALSPIDVSPGLATLFSAHVDQAWCRPQRRAVTPEHDS